MRRGIGQRTDDLQLLDDRARPAMRDDERQRILVLRTHVDEMNVQPVDLGDELRQGVESRLDLAPIVIRRPIARELLHRRKLHALRRIRDGFPVGPSRGGDALGEVSSSSCGKLTVKGRIDIAGRRVQRPGKHADGPGDSRAASSSRRVAIGMLLT